jgi:hypothetical protein
MRKLLVLVMVSAVVLAACGGDSEGFEEQIADQILEDVANDEGFGDVEVDVGDEGVSMTIVDDEGQGEIVLGGGDLPDGFPFPVPDDYEVMTSASFEDSSGTTYVVSMRAPEGDFDQIAALYESFLEAEGFEVDKTSMQGEGDQRFVFMSGQRADAYADVSISVEEVANEGDTLFYDTLVSLSWTPVG